MATATSSTGGSMSIPSGGTLSGRPRRQLSKQQRQARDARKNILLALEYQGPFDTRKYSAEQIMALKKAGAYTGRAGGAVRGASRAAGTGNSLADLAADTSARLHGQKVREMSGPSVAKAERAFGKAKVDRKKTRQGQKLRLSPREFRALKLR